MNELNIQMLHVKPAEIEFNHEDILKELESTLERYKGVIHTEDTTTALRKDIATLRRAKKSINRFRIDRKNEMLLPIIEFENKVKEIESKIQEVELPLTEQENEFEKARKENKLKHVENIRLKVFEESQIEGMTEHVITIENSYLTKTKTLVKIEEEMKQQAEDIKQSIAAKKANEEIITLTVESANSTNDINLSVSAYLSQLDLYDVDSVKATIDNDVTKELERIKQAELREQQRIENENKREEAALIKKQEEAKEEVEQEQAPVDEFIIEDIDFYEAEEIENHVIEFKGTQEQYEQVTSYIDSLNIDWSDF